MAECAPGILKAYVDRAARARTLFLERRLLETKLRAVARLCSTQPPRMAQEVG
jgi:hypothetical protein